MMMNRFSGYFPIYDHLPCLQFNRNGFLASAAADIKQRTRLGINKGQRMLLLIFQTIQNSS